MIPKFAELTRDNPSIPGAALVVDIREGAGLKSFPGDLFEYPVPRESQADLSRGRRRGDSPPLQRDPRPHPLGKGKSILKNIRSERKQLAAIRSMADLIINTSKFTVHELREYIGEQFREKREQLKIAIYVISFGYRNGVPPDSDLVFDVRFLPNPNYIPRFKQLTGRNPSVAEYIRSFPQTIEFIDRISDLLVYLLPHYIREGKSYLTIAFGCTGGQHRSVMIAG